MSTHLYLVKANNELISHCHCEPALISSPAQMDCPWCGCGWLFTCLECRKAFSFARAIETNESWESLGRRDMINFAKDSKRVPDDEDIEEWVRAMKRLHADVELGATYVYLDGVYADVDATDIDYVGWAAHHTFDRMPQVAALKDRDLIKTVLANRQYWDQRAVEVTDEGS